MGSEKNTTVLITGSNRGIGLALAQQYLSRPNTTVIAGVRSPEKATALKDSPKHADNTNLITVKLDSSDNGSPAAAVAELQSAHKITSVDVVIANAGVAMVKSLGETQPQELADILQVNVVGVLNLYQALLPLLRKSTASGGPKFACISSLAGSITFLPHATMFTNGAYGASKAAINFLITKIAYEAPLGEEQGGHGLPNLTAFVLHPGLVETDMATMLEGKGDFSAMDWITPEVSATKLAKVIDNATRETTNGKFFDYEGAEQPW